MLGTVMPYLLLAAEEERPLVPAADGEVTAGTDGEAGTAGGEAGVVGR